MYAGLGVEQNDGLEGVCVEWGGDCEGECGVEDEDP